MYVHKMWNRVSEQIERKKKKMDDGLEIEKMSDKEPLIEIKSEYNKEEKGLYNLKKKGMIKKEWKNLI